MLTINDDLIVTGEVLPGDVYHELCCPGYDFTIATVIVSAWGYCDNPEHRCSDHSPNETCAYCNLNNFELEDIAEFVAEGKEHAAAIR